MYPFKDFKKIRRGYSFMVPTFYSKHHLGTDFIVPVGTPVYAWADLEVIATLVGKEGGNTVWCRVNGHTPMVRLLHNRELPKKGKYKEGDIICYTGNTGVSTGPHSHIDVSINGTLNLGNLSNFTDPEHYFEAFRPIPVAPPVPVIPVVAPAPIPAPVIETPVPVVAEVIPVPTPKTFEPVLPPLPIDTKPGRSIWEILVDLFFNWPKKK